MSSQDSQAPRSTRPWRTYSILIVDDEPFVRDELARVLRLEGLNVTAAASGEDGLRLLDEVAPKVVISDQKMAPGMSGTEFLRQVKERDPTLVTMILSAYAESELVLGAVNEAGAYQYILKPWNEADLLKRVDQALEHYHAQAEVRRLALANERLLRRLAATEQFSLIGEFSTALYDRFSPILDMAFQEQRRQAGHSIRGLDENVGPVVDHHEWFGLAAVVSQMGQLAALFCRESKRVRAPVVHYVEECVQEAEHEAARVGRSVAFLTSYEPDLPRLLLQPDIICRGVRALIENAVVHGCNPRRNEGPHSVTIRVGQVDGPEQAIRIEVQDSGQGVGASKAKAFAPLYSTCIQSSPKLNQGAGLGPYNFSEYDHVGLGLPTARWCFSQLEGSLDLVNPREPEACFRADLPISPTD